MLTLVIGYSMLLKMTIRASNLEAKVQGIEISHKTLPIESSIPSETTRFSVSTSPAKASEKVSSSLKISIKNTHYCCH